MQQLKTSVAEPMNPVIGKRNVKPTSTTSLTPQIEKLKTPKKKETGFDGDELGSPSASIVSRNHITTTVYEHTPSPVYVHTHIPFSPVHPALHTDNIPVPFSPVNVTHERVVTTPRSRSPMISRSPNPR
jgi:hypothetical protein